MSSKIDQVINFALDRENESISFYEDLKLRIKEKHFLEMVDEIIAMERGHINILNKIKISLDNKTFSPYGEKIENLAISEFLVDPPEDAEPDFQQLLIIAMKREEKAKNLYRLLASEAVDKELKDLFLFLSQEEEKHKLQFEKIYDQEVLTEN